MPFREQSRFAILHRGRFVLGISGEEIANLEGIQVRVGARVFFYLFYLCSRSFRFGSTFSSFFAPLTISASPFLHGYSGSRRFFGRWIFKTDMGSNPPERDGCFRFFSGGFGRLGTTNVRVTSNLFLSFFSLPFFWQFILFNGIFCKNSYRIWKFFGPI